MKIFQILIIALFVAVKSDAQTYSSDEKLIREFLTYVKSSSWSIDTMDTKFIVGYPVDSAIGSKELRQKWLNTLVGFLQNHLKRADWDAVKVVPYDQAPDSLQILMLREEYSSRSYVVTDSKAFTRYILIKNNHIQAFDLFQKAFWLMD